MQGFSPKLPLSIDTIDGAYSMNKTALDSIKQDFKMLMLTNPGERMMIPDYGVGLRQLLFSQNTDGLRESVVTRISSQLSRYMSFIRLMDVQISTSDTNENALNVYIEYQIPSFNTIQQINLSLSSN